MSPARLVACVLLPFAAGYFLSYLFRTVNAVIAGNLATDLGLSAADLGLLTSVYFLVFAAVQLPLGALLDRLGPGLVQSTLMLVASAGALVFALADGFTGLVIGRGLIGLGVAVALMAGVKAIGTWFPPERLGLATGCMIMLGALGALTATGPTELMVQAIGWRGLFLLLAGLTALAALLVLFVTPEWHVSAAPKPVPVGFSAIYRDPRFWRVAPLSALGIGTSWSLQGLWAAPWLRDVDGLDRVATVQHLSVMALAVCAGGLLLGTAADRWRRAGIKTESILVSSLGLSMLAQAALVLHWPLPSLLPWTIIAAAGAATVLSFALMSEYFSKAITGRANGALNLLHVGCAFVLQSTTGFIIEQWPETAGSYPAEAHQAAMAVPLALQLVAVGWFAMWRCSSGSSPTSDAGRPFAPSPYVAIFSIRGEQARRAHRRATNWRVAAVAAASLCVALMTALAVNGQADALAQAVPGSPRGPARANLGVPDWLTWPQPDHPNRLSRKP